jgi:hypothetical protein
MTATGARIRARSPSAPRRPCVAAARLMRLELRHNAMLWMLPVVGAVFWFVSYRKTMAMPPLWNLRASEFQGGVVIAFIVPVIGAAAWMGSREARRHMTDLMTASARPRWTRLLATWAATMTWTLAGYAICLAVVYGVTAHQASWGGPLWWPAAVAAASVVAYSALGFAAGTLLPYRLTAPLAGVASFFVVALSTQLITGGQSYWQISPVVAGPWENQQDAGVATFFPYVPDLSIAQLMFLAGVTLAVVSALALRGSGRRVRAAAAVIAAAGLLAAGTAVRLAGTGRLNDHGMIAIPALHDAASGRPIRFTPVCSRTAIPVCLNPAYAGYLRAVTASLAPVLSEIAGLPGAPVRVSQAPGTYQQGPGNSVTVRLAGPRRSGGVYRMLLPDQLQGPPLTVRQLASQARRTTSAEIIASLVGDGPGASEAQQAVAAALALDARLPEGAVLAAAGPPVPPGRIGRCDDRKAACRVAPGVKPGVRPSGGAVLSTTHESAPVAAAAGRFASLPIATQRAWLTAHLTALRAGQLRLGRLP